MLLNPNKLILKKLRFALMFQTVAGMGCAAQSTLYRRNASRYYMETMLYRLWINFGGLSYWKSKTYTSVHCGVLHRSSATNRSYEETT
jgi:hypothetical protein